MRLPPLDEAVATHLCPPTVFGSKVKVSHSSKPLRTTSAPAGRAYTSAGQAGSALHTMAVLQVFQPKLLHSMDESSPDLAVFRELHSPGYQQSHGQLSGVGTAKPNED